MRRNLRAEIDLAALLHNVAQIRLLAPDSAICAVVKADAYGHGIAAVARTLEGRVEAMAVACMSEALLLRRLAIRTPVVILQGVQSSRDLQRCEQLQLHVVVHQWPQLTLLQRHFARFPDSCLQGWFKIDSGLGRLGFLPQEKQHLLKAMPQQTKNWGWMSHMAQANRINLPMTEQQMVRFDNCMGEQKRQSLANSAAVLQWPKSHRCWVRPGLMLYGISPFPAHSGHDHGLLPVMQLSAPLIAINKRKKGSTVGYEAAWSCPEDMPVGIVSAGYADGYPQHLAEHTPVLVAGKRTTIIGWVSMDMLAVDLRPVPEAVLGSRVLLWGSELPVEQVADACGWSCYQMVTHIRSRRRYLRKGVEG